MHLHSMKMNGVQTQNPSSFTSVFLFISNSVLFFFFLSFLFVPSCYFVLCICKRILYFFALSLIFRFYKQCSIVKTNFNLLNTQLQKDFWEELLNICSPVCLAEVQRCEIQAFSRLFWFSVDLIYIQLKRYIGVKKSERNMKYRTYHTEMGVCEGQSLLQVAKSVLQLHAANITTKAVVFAVLL